MKFSVTEVIVVLIIGILNPVLLHEKFTKLIL